MRYGYGSLILQNSIYLGIKIFWVCSFGRYIRLKGIGAPFLQSRLTCSKTVTSLSAQSGDYHKGLFTRNVTIAVSAKITVKDWHFINGATL